MLITTSFVKLAQQVHSHEKFLPYKFSCCLKLKYQNRFAASANTFDKVLKAIYFTHIKDTAG